MKSKTLAFATFALLACPLSANAAIISGTYNFSATIGGGAPISPVLGSFTISFDDSASIAQSTTGFTLNSINIASGPAGYSYTLSTNILRIGGTLNTVNAVSSGTNDWSLRITNISTSPTFGGFLYSQVGSSTTYATTSSGSLTATAVPEPATLALLGLGLAGLGLARRKRAA